MKILATLFLFLCAYYTKAQIIEPKDTAIVLSMTIFNRKTEVRSHFPDVYPNIHQLYVISGVDTVSCNYKFPFLTMAKEGYSKIKNRHNSTLYFTYDYITAKTNSRYRLLVPIKFYFTNKEDAKFIVIEHYDRDKFFAMQSWGAAFFTGEKVKVEKVYE